MNSSALKVSFIINSLGSFVPIAVSLVTVPLYIHHIGDARYGVMSIVWILLGYFGFLDMGLSRAATNALSRLRDAPQQDRARVIVTTMALNLLLGSVGSLVFAFVGNYLLQNFLGVPENLKPEIAEAMPWIVALFPLALLSGVAIGTIESREKFLLANALQVTGGTIGQIMPVLLAITISPSLAVVVPAAVVVRVLTVAATLVAVWRSEGPLNLSAFEWRQARALVSYGGWISVSAIIGPILTSVDQFVIGSIAGVAQITYYAVPMNLVGRTQIFAAALARTLFPRLSSVSPAHALELAERATASVAYGYGALCAPVMIIIPLFFQYWIGGEFASTAAPIAQTLLFGAWINGVAFVPFSLIQGQKRPDISAKIHAVEVIPFVAILWALTTSYGAMGAAIAWGLRNAVDAALMIWAAKLQSRHLALSILLPFLLLVGSRTLAHSANTSVASTFSMTAICGFIGAVLALVMSGEIRRALISAIPKKRLPVES
jgi:O-antigen/teichoic acid export membrane protein